MLPSVRRPCENSVELRGNRISGPLYSINCSSGRSHPSLPLASRPARPAAPNSPEGRLLRIASAPRLDQRRRDNRRMLLDNYDVKILGLLQRDSKISQRELSEAVNLSPSGGFGLPALRYWVCRCSQRSLRRFRSPTPVSRLACTPSARRTCATVYLAASTTSRYQPATLPRSGSIRSSCIATHTRSR
jgi:hypothetical protein